MEEGEKGEEKMKDEGYAARRYQPSTKEPPLDYECIMHVISC